MNQKTLQTLITYGLATAFFVPLVVLPKSFIFPFIVPKILLFRSLTILLLGGYLLLAASNWQRYKPSLSPTNIVVGLFLLSFTISSIVGVDPYRSMWDNHERMLGLFTLLHYGLFYLIATSVLKTKEAWQFLIRSFMIAGGIVMAIGFLQITGEKNLLLNNGSNRVSSTLGNPIYFSGYGLFLFAIGGLGILKEKARSFWMKCFMAGGILGLFGIFLGGTRGAFLGLLAGGAAFLCSYIFLGKMAKKTRKRFIVALVAALLVLPLLYSVRDTRVVKSIPAIDRLVNIDVAALSTNTRVMAWSIAVEAWQDKPVFGWGPNNYYYAFNEHYRPSFLRHGFGETWFDNAHSSVFNTLAVQGAVGLVLYLALFVVPIISLFRWARREDGSALEASILTGFLLSHFVSMFFVFENPTSYLYFFFTLAYIAWRTLPTKATSAKKKRIRISTGMAGGMLVVVLLCIYVTNINPARANTATLRMIQAMGSATLGHQIDTMSFYEAALAIPTPHVDDNRSDFARNVLTTARGRLEHGQQEEVRIHLARAWQELEINKQLHPKDIRILMTQAEIAMLSLQLLRDEQYIPLAEPLLEEALVYSPGRQQLEYMLANVKLILGKNEEAIAILEGSIANDPEIPENWAQLVIMHALQKNQVAVEETYRRMEQYGIRIADHIPVQVNAILEQIGTATTTQ